MADNQVPQSPEVTIHGLVKRREFLQAFLGDQFDSKNNPLEPKVTLEGKLNRIAFLQEIMSGEFDNLGPSNAPKGYLATSQPQAKAQTPARSTTL